MQSICALCLLALVLTVPALAAPPVVSNVRGVQRAGTKLVDITYDLADPDTAALTVSLQISADAGATWTVPVAGSTGHLGAGVSPGAAKQIVWNAGTNWNNQYSAALRFRVLADDGTVTVPTGFSLIPAGTFLMGDQSSPQVGYANEFPVHSVNVSAFYMTRTEVSYAQWQATYSYATANGYTFDNPGLGKATDHPVQTVSWYDVVKWCNAMSQQDGLPPCYTVSGVTYKTGQSDPVCDFTRNGYRLPTEAEWEKAARGGQTGLNFPWGKTITHSQANYFSDFAYSFDISPTRGYHPTYATGDAPYTSPVGAFTGNANGYGLFDVTGNVWEWCWDWYGNYPASGSAVSDPRGASTGSYRVVRGGSWDGLAGSSRAALRVSFGSSSRSFVVGFRLARSSAAGSEGTVVSADSPNSTVFTIENFRITGVRRTGAGGLDVSLDFNSLAGVTYRAEKSSDLTPGAWTNTGVTATGNGAVQKITIPGAGLSGRLYFRVVLE